MLYSCSSEKGKDRKTDEKKVYDYILTDVQLFGILWDLHSISNVLISPECGVIGTDSAGEISVHMCWPAVVVKQCFISLATAPSITHTWVGCFALFH